MSWARFIGYLASGVIVTSAALFNLGCLEDKGKSSSIVIPPGALIHLDMKMVNEVSERSFALYLSEATNSPRSLNNLIDLTSNEKPDVIREIMPKTVKIEKGIMVARVVMEYRNTPWFAIVFPEVAVTPNIDTTLVFQLLSNFPNRDIRTFSLEDIRDIQQKIEEFRARRMALFRIPSDFNSDLVYRFLRNGLSNDATFLEFLETKGIEFDFDGDGNILSEPYPFGIRNRSPEVDYKSTTRLIPQQVKELSELKVRASARDPDGDEVFYAWTLDDEPFASTDNAFVWTPDYDASRGTLYEVTVLVSDGGQVTQLSWAIDVQNLNRRPVFEHNCPATFLEGSEISCTVNYTDPDGEAVDVNVLPIEGSNPVFVDDVNPAPYAVVGRGSLGIRWTPNNGDALKRQGILSLEMTDPSGGMTIAAIVIKIQGSNRVPFLVTGPTVVDPARQSVEWDTCAKQSSDGEASPYRFTMLFEDPDNMGPSPADPLDKILIVYGGSLRTDIVEESKIVNPDGRTEITYVWRPIQARLSGTWTLSIRDDQGGISPPIIKNMNAQNRNSFPCLNAWDNVVQVSSLNPSSVYSFSASDPDGVTSTTDMPIAEIFDVDSNALFLKHTIDARINRHMVMRRKFFEAAVSYRRRDTSHSLRFFPKTTLAVNNVFIAGYIKLVRPPPYSSELTIPKGTELGTIIPLTGVNAAFSVLYETADVVQFDPGDAEIWIPVKAKSRNTPAGTLTTFATVPAGGAVIPADFVVTNFSSIGETGLVTVSRTNAAANFTFTRYQVISGNSGSSSYEHLIPDDFVFPAGQTSISFPVWKRIREVPANQALIFTGPAPGGVAFTVTSVSGLMDWNDTEIKRSPTYTAVDSLFKVRVLDGSNVGANLINTPMDSTDGVPAGEGGTLTFTHPAGMFVVGQLTIKRSKATSIWSLPAGTRIRTGNFTIYSLVESADYLVGENSKVVWVKRENHVGLLNRVTAPVRPHATPRFRWVDSNTPMSILSDETIYASEASDLQGALVDFSEASEIPNPLLQVHPYWYPKDRYDFYSFSFSFPGAVPKYGGGAVKLCRQPGTFASACTACDANAVSSTRSHFRSSRCYIRYRYHDEDLSKVFPLRIQLRESVTTQGRDDFDTALPAANLNYWTNHSVNLVIKEVNDPPVVVDSSFVAIPAPTGQGHTTPINLGAFTEGVSSALPIYILDSDRGSALKRVALTLGDQVYDLKNNSWVPTPDGVLVNVVSEVNNDSTGRGLRTTAELVWKPNDADAKRLGGTDGFVFKVTARDNVNNPSDSLSTNIYYKVVLQNLNNSPSITEITSTGKIRVFADTYIKFQIEVQDPDFETPQGGSFQTRFSFCRDINNNVLLHPILDGVSADPTTCHANQLYWPEILTQYSATYQDNSAVADCRSGLAVNEDLAVPKISPDGPPLFINQKYRQVFKVEWCPQKTHIGKHTISFVGTDNGDRNRDGLDQVFKATSIPLLVDVVAPVYFISPRTDLDGNPTHFMKQASAGLSAAPFIYEVIVSNTLGNPLRFELLETPRNCAQENGMCIDESTGRITWVPKHPDDITMSGPGHLVRLKVTDLVTSEVDTVSFYLKVQNAVSPFEAPPTLDSYSPLVSDITLSEEKSLLFSVNASDSNANDSLHYRWYINDKIVNDEGPSYLFKATDRDGSVDRDGDGPAKLGEYQIRSEITDGNYIISKSWNLKIRNTKILGELIFDLKNARLERAPSKLPKNVFWIAEVPNSIDQGGVLFEHMVFAGSYELDVGLKNFIWDLPFKNGQPVRQNLVRSPWNLIEDLPWPVGKKSERLVINASGVTPEAIVTAQSSRAGPFATTVEAVRLPMSDWTSLEIGAVNKCLGDCPNQLYTSAKKSGDRITLTYDGSYVFYASDDRKKLNHDFLTPSNITLDYNFGAELISGIGLNRNLNRIYVTTQGVTQSKLYIFSSANISNGGPLSLVTSFHMWDGVTGHENARASDISVDDSTGRIFLLLTGTGGVATLLDTGGVPLPGDLTFVGVGELGDSSADLAGLGSKLSLNRADKILYGVMRESQQVFSIDTDTLEIQVASTPSPIDSIYTFPSGMILLVDREKARIYFSK